MKPKVNGATFVPTFDECEQHGRYPINTLGPQGEVRYMVPGCPACRRQDDARRLMQQAEIPARFQECGFENFEASTPEQRTVLATCRTYAEHFTEHHASGTCLILRGGVGAGKTHLSVAIARCVMTAGFSALHVTGYALMDRIRASGFGERRTVVEQLARIDLLIIDEVGKTYGSKGELVDLFHIVDARYCKRRPTILVSNESTDTIKLTIGEAAYDRLREGGGKVVNFCWQSARGRAARNREPI